MAKRKGIDPIIDDTPLRNREDVSAAVRLHMERKNKREGVTRMEEAFIRACYHA